MRTGRSLTLYCFSPAVILATFAVETVLAVYAFLRYRATRFGRLAAVFLALLAAFQLGELMICRGAPPEPWARFSFIATAWLPVLGLDLIGMLSGRKRALGLGYATAAAFSLAFAFLPGAVTAAACTGRFVAFVGFSPGLDTLYGIYYMAMLLLGIGLTVDALRRRAGNLPALRWLLVGYLAFMVPAIALYILVPASQPGFPSILCGFAVFVALIGAFRVLPLVRSSGR